MRSGRRRIRACSRRARALLATPARPRVCAMPMPRGRLRSRRAHVRAGLPASRRAGAPRATAACCKTHTVGPCLCSSAQAPLNAQRSSASPSRTTTTLRGPSPPRARPPLSAPALPATRAARRVRAASQACLAQSATRAPVRVMLLLGARARADVWVCAPRCEPDEPPSVATGHRPPGAARPQSSRARPFRRS